MTSGIAVTLDSAGSPGPAAAPVVAAAVVETVVAVVVVVVVVAAAAAAAGHRAAGPSADWPSSLRPRPHPSAQSLRTWR